MLVFYNLYMALESLKAGEKVQKQYTSGNTKLIKQNTLVQSSYDIHGTEQYLYSTYVIYGATRGI